MNVQNALRARFFYLWRLTQRDIGGIFFPLLPFDFLKSAAPGKPNRKQARDNVTCHTRRKARGVARIGCKHCHLHKPSCQGTTPRCSTFTFLLTRLTTIGKNYNLSFFLACMVSLTIASARSFSLGEPQWRESFFSRLCNCCVNSWHANNRCRFVWQSYPSDWSYNCNKSSKRRGREGCSRC